jgi:hypothetical protein
MILNEKQTADTTKNALHVSNAQNGGNSGECASVDCGESKQGKEENIAPPRAVVGGRLTNTEIRTT